LRRHMIKLTGSFCLNAWDRGGFVRAGVVGSKKWLPVGPWVSKPMIWWVDILKVVRVWDKETFISSLI
jgi:hypothetical protein